jgi:hypothetical protein
METKNREKLLLIGTGAVAALWVLNLIVVSPLTDSWHSRSAEIAKLKEEIANGASLTRRGETIRDRWDDMRANALANNPTAAERQLFNAFDRWVSAGGVSEGSFHPQPQEGDSNFTTVDCRSDVSGNLSSITDFLRAMSKDPLANKVDSFELTSKDDNGRQLTLGLSLSGLILTGSDPTTIQIPPKPVEPPPPQDTNSTTNLVMDPFRLITRNNIFDQSRVYRYGDDRPRTVTPVHHYETLTSCGAAVFDGKGSAFFDGAEVSAMKAYNVGDSVSDFKIARITPNTVTLTNASSNLFVLPTDRSTSLKREDNGPWTLSGYAAAVATPDANTTNLAVSASSAPAAVSAADDIIAKLKKKREQEEK